MPNSNKTLSDNVQRLITQKLRHQQRKQQRQFSSMCQTAYSRLGEGISANINSGKLEQAFSATPIDVYNEIVVYATTVTNEWPSIVWKIIASILEKHQHTVNDGLVFNNIVDSFAWAVGQKPFTCSYIDHKKFAAIVIRETSRYGVNREDLLMSFNRQLKHAAAEAKCGIHNTARQARKGVGIAIDEYLFQQQSNSNAAMNPKPKAKTTPREIRKKKTKARYKVWHREYIKLKRANPTKSDKWCAEQIAKMKCALGRNSETIRKQMKKKVGRK